MKKLLLSFLLVVLALPALAIIGNTNTSTSADTISTVINAGRFLATSNQTVDRIVARVAGVSGGGYRCAIYSGSASYPSNFIAGTSQVNATTNGWYSFPLSGNVNIVSNNNYWLAIWSSVNGSVFYSSGGTLRWTTNSYTFGNWPTTLPTASGAAFNYSIYAANVFVTNTPVRPSFTTQPQNQTNALGSNVVFAANASGSTPIAYQWYFSGYTNVTSTNQMGLPITTKTNLPFLSVVGATNNSLSRVVNNQNLGRYLVSAANAAGSTNSSAAYLGMTNLPSNPYIVFNFTWTNSPNVVRYELWSTTNLTFPFNILTNLGITTSYTLFIPKNNAPPQQFFKLVAYTSSGGSGVKSVTLAWDASPDASVTGYRLHIGDSTFHYTNSAVVGNVLTARVENLMPSATYSFAATAYDAQGVESPFSNEIQYTTPAATGGVTTLLDWPYAATITY